MKQKAFTLVELAIVITIIGLLIGGVLKGQELLQNTRMTALGSNLKSYQAALTSFRDIYKGIPGDISGATNYITGCTGTNNCVNGNGNGVIDGDGGTGWYTGYNSAEVFQAWKQMALAGLVKGVDTTRAYAAGAYTADKDVPSSPLGGQLYLRTANGDCTSIGQNMCAITAFLSQSTTGDYTGSTLLSPADAQKIDLKLDDGVAFSGDAQAVSNGWTAGCGTSANGATGYNVNTGGKPCDMGFLIGK